MCLYPKLITNPKYKKNQKNGGVIPPLTDKRKAMVPIGCQKCMECRKKKAREWTVRLQEDIKEHKGGRFVTFSFSDKSLRELDLEINEKYEGYERDNAIATLAIRRFLERWRAYYGKSMRHWIVSELGQNNTERIHLHGIIWPGEKITKAEVLARWQYGHMGWESTWEQENNRVNNATVNYIVKYLSKSDPKHPNYISLMLTSSGIGRRYTNSIDAKCNTYNGKMTRETYRLNNGAKIGLPIYYRNKIYSEEQREELWMQKLDKGIRYVNGDRIEVKTEEGERQYWELLKYHQKINVKMKYADDTINWEKQQYEKQLRNLKRAERREAHLLGGGGKKPPREAKGMASGGANSRIQ